MMTIQQLMQVLTHSDVIIDRYTFGELLCR